MDIYKPEIDRKRLQVQLSEAIDAIMVEGVHNTVRAPREMIVSRPITKAQLRNTANILKNRMEINLQEFGEPLILTTGAEASVVQYPDRLKFSRFSIHNHPYDQSITPSGLTEEEKEGEGDLNTSLLTPTEIDFIIHPLGIIAFQPKMRKGELNSSYTLSERILSVIDNSVPFWTRLFFKKGIIRTSLSWDDPKTDIILDYINSPAKKWRDVDGKVRGLSIIPALFKG